MRQQVMETEVNAEAVLEAVSWENIAELFKNINRERKAGKLCVMNFSSHPIMLGRWTDIGGKLLKCDDLSEAEKARSAEIMAEMGAIRISDGTVIYENDDCAFHHTVKGTGDCNCE